MSKLVIVTLSSSNPNGIHNDVPILNVIALHLFPRLDVPVINVEANEHEKVLALHRTGCKKSRGLNIIHMYMYTHGSLAGPQKIRSYISLPHLTQLIANSPLASSASLKTDSSSP